MHLFLDQQKSYRDCLREVHGEKPDLKVAKDKLKKLFLDIVEANEEHKENPMGKKFASEDKTSLELAFRSSLEELMKKISNSKNSQKNFPPESLVILMDLALSVTKLGFMDSTAPFSLLESVFDYQTIYGCCKIFEFLESRIEYLRAPELWTKLAQLAFLRICNGLLRRLSKTNNTIFCGKILMLMAYVFPLDDPSGQNKNSKFNLANVTPIHKENGTKDDDTAMKDDEEEEKGDKKKEGEDKKAKKEIKEKEKALNVDFKFYRILWGLQKLFNHPLLLNQEEHWKTFEKGIATVLKRFEKNPLSAQDNLGQLSAANYFPKYLTSPKLLSLQLRDCSFRRYFLLQCCVLFQLLCPPSTKGTKSTGRKLHQLSLTKVQHSAIRKMAENVMKLLNQNPVEKGSKPFAQEVEKILAREAIWIRWKENQCPKIQVKEKIDIGTPITIKFPGEKKSKGARIKMNHMGAIVRRKGERVPMGTEELARLWSISEDNLGILVETDRIFTPNYPEFMNQMLEEDTDPDLEEEMKLKNNKLFTWRCLRLTSNENFQLFLKSNNGTLNPVLEELRKQKEKDKEVKIKEDKDKEEKNVAEKTVKVNGHSDLKDETKAENGQPAQGKKRKRDTGSEAKTEEKVKAAKQENIKKEEKKAKDDKSEKDVVMEETDKKEVAKKKVSKDDDAKKIVVVKETDAEKDAKKTKIEKPVKEQRKQVEKEPKSDKAKGEDSKEEETKDKEASAEVDKNNKDEKKDEVKSDKKSELKEKKK